MVQENSLKEKILVISGPTAVGKSNIAVKCAMKYDGEIISADSMQIYKGLDIGTGKIKTEEKNNIPHYMIDIINVNEEFSVSEYVTMSKYYIKKIIQKGKLPIIVGGTGLYINALLNGHNFACAPKSQEIRDELNEIVSIKGKQFLFDMLKEVDSKACEKLCANDVKRVARALEIFKITGKTKSEQVTKKLESEYDYLFLALDLERSQLYQMIEKRVDIMVENGLIDEVKKKYLYKDCQSMQAIGYKEVISFLDEKYDANFAIDLIKKNSRHYAKRQLTYLKGMENVVWIENTDWAKINELLDNFIVL